MSEEFKWDEKTAVEFADYRCLRLLDYVAFYVMNCWQHNKKGRFELSDEIGSISSKELLKKFKQYLSEQEK